MTLQLSGTLATNHKPGGRGEGQGVGGCGDTNEPTNEPFDPLLYYGYTSL